MVLSTENPITVQVVVVSKCLWQHITRHVPLGNSKKKLFLLPVALSNLTRPRYNTLPLACSVHRSILNSLDEWLIFWVVLKTVFLRIVMCTVLAPDRDFISSDSLSYLPSSPNILAAWCLTYLIKDAIARDVTVYYAISIKIQKKIPRDRS